MTGFRFVGRYRGPLLEIDSSTMSEASSDESPETGNPAPSGADKLYAGNKQMKKKLVRLLTVMAYVMSVSMAAIMLSLYYIFLWDPRSSPRYGRQVADDAPYSGVVVPQVKKYIARSNAEDCPRCVMNSLSVHLNMTQEISCLETNILQESDSSSAPPARIIPHKWIPPRISI